MDENKRHEVQNNIREVYAAMEAKGYDPLGQILRYVLSGNPAFITRYKGARDIITKMDIPTLLNGVADYTGYVRDLAYRDVLTGAKSKASYFEMTNLIKEDIDEKLAHFCIVVGDLNNLKTINDTKGHAVGDVYICAAAQIMMKVAGRNSVYRVGGDEFVIILNKYDDIEDKIAMIHKEVNDYNIENNNEDYKLQIALGYSVYKMGDSYELVFARADGAMYTNKQKMKLNVM